ncbi:DNA-packaging protein [Sphingomonas alba]|uniref:Terminase family protein n=1 Tax=Sphingomonas alba TaxID=2908208 RepID=A0ABT0RNS9_9SPHN|nr:terminase family protein [Sphingomonas alba]MCL6684293.1 terminase family protein [Sphingomonas alba]
MLRMSPEELRDFLEKCGPRGVLLLDAAFEMWADEGQLPPLGEGWRVWLMMAGRGYGKTRAGAEWINNLAQGVPKHIALVAATIDEARSIMVEGVSGILSIARKQRVRVKWEPSKGRLIWPKGTVAQLFSGDNADGLRGPELSVAWCDELAKWRQAEEAWTNLQMGLRAGPRPRALVTTTPRPIRLLKRIRDDAWTVTTGGRTKDNVSLPKAFIEVMMATYAKTRIGRQELDGELIEDVEGSLWPRALIETCRCEMPSRFDRVVVGVDPPAGPSSDSGQGGDACGIVVCAKAGEQYYVLADESVFGLSPDGWARAVAAAASRWRADRVVAEANNGGAMITEVLRNADSGLAPKLVHASKGKVARAEPVALLFEAKRAWFVGAFPELEDELAGLQIGGGYDGPTRSPDRADAMVWAMSELSQVRASVPRVRAL